ncbi:oxidoreductase [Seiridium cupressi]
MAAIKNITLFGASGALGSVALEKLLASGKFNVRVLKRAGSSSTYAPGAEVVEADLSSLESMTAALQGQDAIVSTAGYGGILGQIPMADAAIAAGVSRFIPSNFGADLTNANDRQLPVFADKAKVEDHLMEKSKTTDLTYTFVYTGAFLDWGLKNGYLLDVSKYQPITYDGGDQQWSATTTSSIGDAIVGVLSKPAETKNRVIRVSDVTLSHNQLVGLAKEIAPSKPWNPINLDLDTLVAKAFERLSQGIFDMESIGPLLTRSIVDPRYGGNFTKVDNELLGLKGKTETDVVKMLKSVIN